METVSSKVERPILNTIMIGLQILCVLTLRCLDVDCCFTVCFFISKVNKGPNLDGILGHNIIVTVVADDIIEFSSVGREVHFVFDVIEAAKHSVSVVLDVN